MPTVIVRIDPKTTLETHEVDGVEGGSCMELTRAIIENSEEVETQLTSAHCVPEELPDYLENMEEE